MEKATIPLRQPIRVVFANCKKLDVPACAYLVLAQNVVQELFEFEVYRLSVKGEYEEVRNWRSALLRAWAETRIPFPLRAFAERRYEALLDRLMAPALNRPLPPRTCIELLKPLVESHDEWLRKLPASYGNWTQREGPTILVTETALEGGYFGWSDEKFAVVSTAEWKKHLVPTSLIEYALSLIQRYAVRMSLSPRVGSHYPTRGCIWDFDAHQPDAAMAHLVGYLCESCQRLVLENTDEDQLRELRQLLSHSWIGDVDDPGTVASTLKRAFMYDLVRTRGARASFWDRAREQFPQQVLSVPGLAIGALFTVLVLWLRKKFALP